MDVNDIKFFGDIDIINKRISTFGSSFSETIYNKDSWYIKAHDLFSAANILKVSIQQELNNELNDESQGLRITLNSTNLSNSYMLLIGFAVEVFLKGIFISREPHNQASLNKMFRLSHNLKDLVSYLEINVTASEEEIINRLTNYTIWDGRYPTPKKESEFSNVRGVFLYNTDFRTIDSLIKKLETEF
jgi:hypothetical protein